MMISRTFQLLSTILIFLSFGCGTADDSQRLSNERLENKIGIEVRISESIESKLAEDEIKALSDKIKLKNNEILIPFLNFKRIDCKNLDIPIKESALRIKFSSIDEASLEISNLKCDEDIWNETYSNFFGSDYKNDSSYINSLKLFTLDNGNIIHKNMFPSFPLLDNEFIVNLKPSSKSDSKLKEFYSAAELMSHLVTLNLTSNSRIVVYYLGGKTARSFIDSDEDGVMDDVDRCPNEKGSINCDGCNCPSNDSDNDGILNTVDKCPTSPGPKKNEGCPLPDDDKDGTPNEADKCPNELGKCNGCPCPSNDRDNDGVLNSNDKCPDEYGSASNNGCPLKPEVSHDNNEGKFYFRNVDFQKQNVEVTIKLMDGSTKIVYPQKSSFPSTSGEYDNLTRELTQAAGITVTVKVTDKSTKALVIPQLTLSNLSLVCLKPEPGAPKKCGFMNTDL